MTEARYGRYEVMGRRKYRDHEPGSTFEARLDKGAERRAIARGDIRLLNEVQPALQPGSYEFPPGWLPADTAANPPRRREAPLS